LIREHRAAWFNIKPAQITSLREAREKGKYFMEEVRCMISLTDGKFVTVVEHCNEARRL